MLQGDLMTVTRERKPKLKSRALIRRITAGNWMRCTECGETLKFRAGRRQVQVIANVYVRSKWRRVEHYHTDCYVKAGEPCGPAEEKIEFP